MEMETLQHASINGWQIDWASSWKSWSLFIQITQRRHSRTFSKENSLMGLKKKNRLMLSLILNAHHTVKLETTKHILIITYHVIYSWAEDYCGRDTPWNTHL